MKEIEENQTPVNAVPLETKTEAAGTERGQQVIPGIVGVVFAFYL